MQREYNIIVRHLLSVPARHHDPHICRHSYCTNMANSGMNPKTLQYLMGHSDVSVTLNH
ncbi:MAG: tyrosine-type recombinase/integrase [Mediterraneibacter gnavus]